MPDTGLTQVGVLTPLRPETLESLQLNAGVFIRNLNIENITTADALKTAIRNIISGSTQVGQGTLFGATRGGGTFTVTRDMRTPDIDGMRYRFKKGQFVDSVDAYLSTTLVEVGKTGNLIDVLGGTLTTEGSVKKITMNTELPDSAYISNVAWVGEISDGSVVVIILYNAVNIADFSLTFADKNEGTIAVEFHACQSAVNDYATAPFAVYVLSPA